MRCDRCCGFDQMTKLIIFCLNGFRSGNLFRPLEPLKKNPYPPAPHPMPPLERQQLIYVRVSLSFCPAMSFSFAPNWVACAITKKKTHNNHRFVTNKISKFLCWVKRRYKSRQCAPFFPPSDFPKKRNENKTKIKCWKNRWATGKLATMWRNIFAL